MNILVSNDDGIQAKGLRVLTEALSAVPGCRVFRLRAERTAERLRTRYQYERYDPSL